MSASKRATREFVSDFELVATHYQLRELGEYETAKQVARNDLDNAVPCFAAMAAHIRDVAQG